MLKEKIEEAFKSNFLSDVSFSDEEIDEMKIHLMDAVEEFDQRASKYFYQSELKEFILLIVYYAHNWGDDEEGTFWVRILGNIFERYTFNVSNRFYDEIEKIFVNYNLVLFRSDSGKRMVRETLLFHAMAPKVSVEAFVKLLFNCCIEDNLVNRSLLTDKDAHRRIANALNKKFSKAQTSEMDQDITLDGNTYSLRSGIKYACRQNTELIIKLIADILSCFNSVICDEQDDDESFINNLVKDVINQIFSKEKNRNKRKIAFNNDPVVLDFSKIFAFYEIIKSEPYLSLPEIRIFDDEMEFVELLLLSNGKVLERKNTEIVGKDFNRKIKKISIPLTPYLHDSVDAFKFQVILKIDNKIVYDSKESLYRKFILMSDSHEIKKDCKPGTYFLLYPTNFNINQLEQVQGIKKNFASITSSEGEYIGYQDKYIFFNSKKQDSHIVLKGNELEKAKFSTTEKEYRVFNKLESITILLNNSLPENVIYKINNNYPQLLTNKKVIKQDNQYTIEFNEQLPELNQITFYDLKQNSKIIGRTEFAIFKKLKIIFNKPYYFEQINGVLTIADGDEFNENFYISGEDDSLSVPYKDGTLEVICPNIKFQIDNKDWHALPISKPVWHKQLHSGSILKLHNNSALKTNIQEDDKNIKQIDEDTYLIGDCVAHPKKQLSNIFLTIDDKRFNLFKIAFVPSMFKEPEFYLEDGFILHDIANKFVGDQNTRLLIELTDENGKIFQFEFLYDDLIETKELEDGYYSVNLYLLQDSLYGYEKKLIYSSEDEAIAFGNVMKLEFRDSIILIQNAKTPLGRVKFENTYISNISYIKEDYYPLYKGILCAGKKSIPVVFERKDDKTIKIYYTKDNELKLVNINFKEKCFTLDCKEDKNIFECFSCFYKKEEK